MAVRGYEETSYQSIVCLDLNSVFVMTVPFDLHYCIEFTGKPATPLG